MNVIKKSNDDILKAKEIQRSVELNTTQLTKDIKFTIIFNCVQSDLQSIEKDNYDDIILKMQSLPLDKLESVLELLNMHVVSSMTHKESTKKIIPHNGFRMV